MKQIHWLGLGSMGLPHPGTALQVSAENEPTRCCLIQDRPRERAMPTMAFPSADTNWISNVTKAARHRRARRSHAGHAAMILPRRHTSAARAIIRLVRLF